MSDSKKSSDEESIVGKIVSSIEKIDKIDFDESKDEKKEDNKNYNKNYKENNKEKSKEDFDNQLPLTSKAEEFLSDDFNRKFPILAIIGTVLGIILIIFGIIFMLSASERVVDSVSSGETGTISIFIIFLGILILALSILKIFAKAGLISNISDNFNDLTLLDETEFDNENSIEKEYSNEETVKLDEIFDLEYEIKEELEELEEESEDEIEELKEELEELEELEEIYYEKVEVDSQINDKDIDSNTFNEDE